MKNAIALFSEPSDAEKAVRMLSDAGLELEQVRIHSSTTIESNSRIRGTTSANSALGSGAGPATSGVGITGAVPGAVLTDRAIETYLRDVGIEGDELPFCREGIKEDGRIVVVSLPRAEAERAVGILAEAGGHVPQSE